MKTITCPNCEEKISKVIEWNTTSIGYEIDLEGSRLDTEPKIPDCAEFEIYACPNCECSLALLCHSCFELSDDDGRCSCTNKDSK